MDYTAKRRIAIVAASYAALIAIAFLAWLTVQFYVGALSVIPVLFISYYLRPPAALVTALVAGVVIAALNANLMPGGDVLNVPPLLDILTLSLALAAIVIVTKRLRETSLANDLLHGNLVKARRAAERDALTGIVNRDYFMRKLSECTEHSTPTERAAVLFCDLDGFKAVNDTYGHLTGDAVLRMAASRLVNTVRAIDTVARLGGDEFGVLVRVLHDAGEVAHMASNIEQAFADPFHAENARYKVGITVGISICPDDGTDPETLLRIADARMYRAKEEKRAARA